MAKDHGKQIKDDAKYEALRKEGMGKTKAARIANTPNSGKKEEKLQSMKNVQKKNYTSKLKK
ncbi:MAG TPA: hypothetical protein VK027_08410 [Chitinophagaceae bacterium]|nr:hypothetical protein [Chitinophagaceae bacterium]